MMRVALRSFSAAWAIRGVEGVRCWKRRSRAVDGEDTNRRWGSGGSTFLELTVSFWGAESSSWGMAFL